MKIFKKIIYLFFDSLSKLVDFLFVIKQKSYINSLKNLSGVTLSPSFSLGKYSSITMKGSGGKLLVADRVRCKQFCNFLIYPGASLTINEGVFFNNYCSVTCLGSITIGKNTLFGEGVKIYDHNHAHEMIDGTRKIYSDNYTIDSVQIGENCWIASNVVILKGVKIGNNVIIGANCLVTKSIPDNAIVKSVQQNDIKIS